MDYFYASAVFKLVFVLSLCVTYGGVQIVRIEKAGWLKNSLHIKVISTCNKRILVSFEYEYFERIPSNKTACTN